MNQKYCDIVLTDIELHITKVKNPKSFGRMMMKSIRNNKPYRVYTNDLKTTKNHIPQCSIDLGKEFEMLQEQLRKEGKELRIFIPKKGLNIFPGSDIIEFIKAHYN